MQDTNKNAVNGQLSNTEIDILTDVGFEAMKDRAATAVLADHAQIVSVSNDPNVIIMPLAQALKTYDFVQDLMFGLVDPEANEHVAMVAEHMHDPLGHFIWVKKGAKVKLPVQTFTLLETPQARQFTHDVTLIDEGAEVEMISGAAVPGAVHKGRHISVSESYHRAGSKVTSVSIEHWGEAMEAYSYDYSRHEKGAQSRSTSIMLNPIKYQESYSHSVLEEDANSVDQSIVFAPKGTERVMNTETILAGAGAKSEDIARMVSAGGRIANNALLIGDAAGSTGFLGCDGLKLSDEGEILAIPALQAPREGAMLSHEASVGMIDSQRLEYLMASGMDEDAARDLIVQGFLALDDDNLPPGMKARVAEMISQAKSGGM
ncbi:MAG: hypothetical protein CSA72_14055 [Rhodobacterales bacterium]|nr:MAG: hypothetical protein CR993_06040 [Rhodobacterales bacterium]PIE09198.1 MAG: hypothetical protein CSA72_14055 [Rhodobacterales bacterium]